jgi:hypothetical protein
MSPSATLFGSLHASGAGPTGMAAAAAAGPSPAVAALQGQLMALQQQIQGVTAVLGSPQAMANPGLMQAHMQQLMALQQAQAQAMAALQQAMAAPAPQTGFVGVMGGGSGFGSGSGGFGSGGGGFGGASVPIQRAAPPGSLLAGGAAAAPIPAVQAAPAPAKRAPDAFDFVSAELSR